MSSSAVRSARTLPRPPGRTSRSGVIVAIMSAELLRLLRDRIALLFIVVMPVAVIVVIGTTFGAASQHVTIGVVDHDRTDTSRAVIAQLRGGGSADLTAYDSVASLRRDIRSGSKVAGVVIPAGFGTAAATGGPATLTVEAVRDQDVQAVQPIVQAAADPVGARLAATAFVVQADGVDRRVASSAVEDAAAELSEVPVKSRTVGAATFGGDNPFSYTAPSNLVLFVFITSLAGGSALVESRRLGLTRRTMAAPVGTGTVIAGFTASRLVVTLVQAGLIVLIGGIVFGVEWGQPIGVAVLVLVYSLMAVGAGLAVGAIATSPEQAAAIGVPVGIALGMLGGCMWPLDVVPAGLRAVGHLTPQAWAMDGFVGLVFEDAGLADIAVDVAVLAGFAATFLGLGVVLLRRALERGT